MATDLPQVDAMWSTQGNAAAPELNLIEKGEQWNPNFIKMETLDEATLSRFMDENDKDDNPSFEPQPICEQAPSPVYLRPKKDKDDGEPTCLECYATFTSKVSLRYHVKAVHNPQHHVCRHCKAVFTKAKYLRQHVIRSHSTGLGNNLHKCPKCSKSFRRQLNWERHASACVYATETRFQGQRLQTPNMKSVQFETEGCLVEVQVEKSTPEPGPSKSEASLKLVKRF